MKHLFAASGGNCPSEYPHKTTINFLKSDAGWEICGHIYEEITDWMEQIRQTLLISGVSDYQAKIVEGQQKAENATTVQFSFENPIDCFHFQAMILGNVPTQHPIHVSANDMAQAETRHKRIHQFAMENDVNLLMSPIFKNSFIVNPAKLYDLVATLRYLDSDKSTIPFPPAGKTCASPARVPEISHLDNSPK